jgi:sulfur carrier protein ThiS
MKVTVEFLSLPNVVKMVGGKEIQLQVPGETVDDLVRALIDRYGQKLGGFLLDADGKLDMAFRIMRNKREWIPRERTSTRLEEGDRLTIMLLVGGG